MKHYISICAGNKAETARRIDLFEWSVLASLPEYAAEKKDDSMLVFSGYSPDLDEYPRLEKHLTRFSSMFIDCDNPEGDKDIIERFKERMSNWDYMIYQTASSTPELPKFRALIPLDGELTWSKYVKKAVFEMFSEFADPRASWFYAPTRDKLHTIYENTTGNWFPSKEVLERANRIEQMELLESQRRDMANMRWILSHPDQKPNPEGWRNLPSVKKCLEGLHVGERDNALCAACYAMDKNGYRSSIPQFIDECDVEMTFKRKWKSRYR